MQDDEGFKTKVDDAESRRTKHLAEYLERYDKDKAEKDNSRKRTRPDGDAPGQVEPEAGSGQGGLHHLNADETKQGTYSKVELMDLIPMAMTRWVYP